MPQRAGVGRATSSSGLRRNLIATPTWADEIFDKHRVASGGFAVQPPGRGRQPVRLIPVSRAARQYYTVYWQAV
jgi:hypothetical protein